MHQPLQERKASCRIVRKSHGIPSMLPHALPRAGGHHRPRCMDTGDLDGGRLWMMHESAFEALEEVFAHTMKAPSSKLA